MLGKYIEQVGTIFEQGGTTCMLRNTDRKYIILNECSQFNLIIYFMLYTVGPNQIFEQPN